MADRNAGLKYVQRGLYVTTSLSRAQSMEKWVELESIEKWVELESIETWVELESNYYLTGNLRE